MQSLTGTFFITGTGTDIGKTYTSVVLLNRAQRLGQRVLGLKPVASGSINGVNEDAVALQQASNIELDLSQINPFCFEDPIAPHIAAAKQNVALAAEKLVSSLPDLNLLKPDLCLIEGAGGWEVPLNEQEMWSDFVIKLDIPVILVVGMTLGCINHAILSERAILADNCVLHGWIANPLDVNMLCYQENLQTLKKRLKSPFLG